MCNIDVIWTFKYTPRSAARSLHLWILRHLVAVYRQSHRSKRDIANQSWLLKELSTAMFARYSMKYFMPLSHFGIPTFAEL
jgi:hypothetical protein